MPLTREVNRVLALDGGHISRTQLKGRMKTWAAQNMKPTPDDRTIGRKADELVAPDVVPE